MKYSRVSRLIACFLANVMAVVVFSSTAVAQHVPNQPPEISQFQGRFQEGIDGEIPILFLSAKAIDPEAEQVCIRFNIRLKWNNWCSEWSEYQPSNSLFEKEYWPEFWLAVGSYTVQVQAKDSEGAESDWSEPIWFSIPEIVVPPNLPPETPQLQGPSQGLVNKVLTFSATVIDPEADQVCLNFQSSTSQYLEFFTGWSEYQPSGSVFTVSHSWTNSGTFIVQVQARDSFGNLSDRSSPVTIEVSDSIVSVDSGSEIPRTFVLFQNYPNPFNPITEIAFSLPENSHVTLAVFNSLGQQIAVLADESRGAGQHQVIWDGAGFTNGVYFYRLSAKGFAETRKMLLLK